MSRRPILPGFLSGLLFLGLLAAPLRAGGDDEAAAPTYVTFEVDLLGLVATPEPAGPNLATPADLIAQGTPESWNQDPGDERTPWLAFSTAEGGARALSVDEFLEAFHLTSGLAGLFDEDERARVGALDHALLFTVPAAYEARIRDHVAWLLAAVDPTLTVEVVLERLEPTPAVRGLGRAVVHPGRWTRVAFLKEEVPCVVGAHVSIAQDAVVMDPYVQNLVEGHEVYVRFHPGESRHLLEVWCGELEHVRTNEVSVQGLQGTLRTSEPGVLDLPTTRVLRAATALVVPAGSEAVRTIGWTRGDVVERLVLRAQGPAASPAPRPLGEGGRSAGIVRPGALHAPLEHDARPTGEGLMEWIDAYVARTQDPEAEEVTDLAFAAEGERFVLHATEAHLERVRARLVEAERALRALEATVEVLAVPSEVWRAEGADRALMPGRVLDGPRRQALLAGGSVVLAGLRLPLVEGVTAGLRVGESVPGLIDLDAEVAEKAAALQVLPWALFDGLFGSVTAHRGERGWIVLLGGGVAWADPAAGGIDLVPSGIRLPLLSGGGGDLAGSTSLARNAEGPSIAAAIVRGEEVLLVLIDVRTAE